MPETGEQRRQRIKENLRRLKAANRPQTEINHYLASEREVPEKVKQSKLDAFGAGIETFLDAGTLGGSGLIADAVGAMGDKTYAGMRKARKERKGQFREDHQGLATALEIGGALATPLPFGGVARGLKIGGSLVKQAPQTAGWLNRTFRVTGDAAAQSGIAGTVGNLDELSLKGVGSALKAQANLQHVLGPFIAGGLGAATGVGSRLISRYRGMKRPDKKAFEIDDRIRKMDVENYGTAMGEATATPPISAILNNDPVIAPIANEIQKLARYRGESLNDAQVAAEVYKRLSANQRAAQAVVNRAEDYRPDLAGELEQLGTAKGKLLDAIEAPLEVTTMGRAVYVPPGGQRVTRESKTISIGAGIPSLRKAIDDKRIAEAGRDAYERGGDFGESIGAGKNLPMNKQLTQSREALLREIPDMSSADAELMLAGVLGRTPEAIRMSTNVLAGFGLLGSAVRLPLQMYRTGDIVRALEAKIGRGKMAQKASDLTRGTLARILGAESPR